MTETNSLFPPSDLDVQRRRALAKVYRLLIRLAEEAENKAAIQTAAEAKEPKPTNLESSDDNPAAS